MAPRQSGTAVKVAEPIPLSAVPRRRSGRIEGLQQQVERLSGRLRLAVIYGGDKSADDAVIHTTANTRPWKSYEAVAEDIAASLKRLGFRHVIAVPEDMRLLDRLRRDDIHMAWLNTGGVQGYNPMSHAPAMLEMLGLPYLGHDPLTVGVLDNKQVFKRELVHLGVPTAPFVTWHLARGPFRPRQNKRFIEVFRDHWGPFVVKPVSGRASLHVHLVEDESDLSNVVTEVFEKTGNHVLIEGYLPGREFCVAVSGPVTAHNRRLARRSEPFAFATIERLFEADERIFTSMDVRPIQASRFTVLDAEEDADVIGKLEELAREVFIEMNLESIIRLDVRADARGNLHVLEANPKPDLKFPQEGQTSLVCGGLPRHNMDYDDLILALFADRLDLLMSQRRGSVSHFDAILDASRTRTGLPWPS